MNVLVIGGGISGEREVSLRSARSVFDAVKSNHSKFFYDWKGEEPLLLPQGQTFDVALPILHGPGGEDGHIQRLLEEAGIPYLGAGVEVSKVCIDKVQTQKILAEHSVLVPKQATVTAETYEAHPLTQKPHVLKPIEGGSSLDTYVVLEGLADLQARMASFNAHHQLIIEEYIPGTEITIPVLDGYELPVIKIIPPEGFFDYKNKYSGETQEICEPFDIDITVQRSAQKLAHACHTILGVRHLSRVDIIINPNGQLYVLEINTMPGLTDQSLFPKAAAHVGMSMPDLVEYFIKLAAKANT